VLLTRPDPSPAAVLAPVPEAEGLVELVRAAPAPWPCLVLLALLRLGRSELTPAVVACGTLGRS
jgi:hypothetical protein